LVNALTVELALDAVALGITAEPAVHVGRVVAPAVKASVHN
jgi:hypothetical protein